MAVVRRFCTFFLDELWFGLKVESVQEVLPAPAITPVPLAPNAIAGLVNLRGQIVTAIDLRRRLRTAERPAVVPLPMLVVHVKDARFGLLVTRMDEVVEPPESGFETASLGELVVEVYTFSGQLLHVLDLDKVVGDGKQVPCEIAVE